MNYEIKELRKIEVSELQVSAEAAGLYPGGDGDRAALGVSLDDVGLLEPITVSKHLGAQGGWMVLDGAGRLAKMASRGVTEVECMVVDCSDWNKYVLSKNTMGRGRSAGCRIMSYLVMHRVEVLEFRREDAARQGGGTHVSTPPSEGADFSSYGISERLGYSHNNEDVCLGIQLLWCESEGVDHKGNELDAVGREMLRKTLNDVLRGKTPIRRWKAGLAGTVTGSQENEGGKQNKNYFKSMRTAVISIEDTFKHWGDVTFSSPEKMTLIQDKFKAAFDIAPDLIRTTMIESITDWPDNWKNSLRKRLK